jgi:hypothetical protein
MDMGPRCGLEAVEKKKYLLPLPGIKTKFLGHPACSTPLNILSYPGSTTINKTCINLNIGFNNKTIREVATTTFHGL